MKEQLTLSEARALRERFFEGDLSQAETRRLACFVCGDACPEEWRGERDFWFLHFAEPSLPAGFAASLEAHMKRVENETSAAETVLLPSPWSLRRRRATWAVAAGAALVLTFAGWHFLQPEPRVAPLAKTATVVSSDELRLNHVSAPPASLARVEKDAAAPVAKNHMLKRTTENVALSAETVPTKDTESANAVSDAASALSVSEISDRSPDEVYSSTVHTPSEALAVWDEMDNLLREAVESQCVNCLWESLFDAPYNPEKTYAAEEPADATEETGESTEPLLRSVGDVLQILF